MKSTNIAESHQKTRGQLPERLRSARTFMAGAGALGSAIADIMVRMGLQNIAVADPEKFTLNNLRRHTLTIDAFDEYKAPALAERLNAVSVFADAKGIVASVTRRSIPHEALDSNLLIDCTAEDDAIYGFATLDDSTRSFFSFSLGAHARRMFAFSSDGSSNAIKSFIKSSDEFFAKEKRESSNDPTIRDVGCHNPAFPAPLNRIVQFAGLAVEFMTRTPVASDGPLFEVFEI